MNSVFPLDRAREAGEARTAFRRDVLAGLARVPKRLPSKYFYDARGSDLFERICAQPEYYLTAAELELMRVHAADIAAALGPGLRLVEYGSGSGIKTRLLLQHLENPLAYVPVEISSSALADSVAHLAASFPRIEMLPLCADFTAPLTLPRARQRPRRTVVYFPGSTLGNFDARDAAALLAEMRVEAGHGGAALVGIDLVKDRVHLEAAYNDAAGITAAFTLNLLTRINRELGADFDVAAFQHRARWNAMAERIETSLVSRRGQRVVISGTSFDFDVDEAIAVEISCKYTPASFGRLAARAGWQLQRGWTDPGGRFALYLLV